MGIVISLAIQKGGCAKTTTTFNMGAILKEKGYKVLLIDLDAQKNLSFASGYLEDDKTIFDVLVNEISIQESIIMTDYFDLIPGSENLDKAPYIFNEEDSIYVLKNVIEKIKDDYDFILLDNPPSLNIVLANSLVASDYVIIPTEPSFFGLQGMTRLYSTIEEAKQYNPKLLILGILLVKYSRAILNRDTKEMLEDIADQMQTIVFKTSIREGVVVKESIAKNIPLIKYDKNSKLSKPTIDYKGFTSEVIKMIKEKNKDDRK